MFAAISPPAPASAPASLRCSPLQFSHASPPDLVRGSTKAWIAATSAAMTERGVVGSSDMPVRCARAPFAGGREDCTLRCSSSPPDLSRGVPCLSAFRSVTRPIVRGCPRRTPYPSPPDLVRGSTKAWIAATSAAMTWRAVVGSTYTPVRCAGAPSAGRREDCTLRCSSSPPDLFGRSGEGGGGRDHQDAPGDGHDGRKQCSFTAVVIARRAAAWRSRDYGTVSASQGTAGRSREPGTVIASRAAAGRSREPGTVIASRAAAWRSRDGSTGLLRCARNDAVSRVP